MLGFDIDEMVRVVVHFDGALVQSKPHSPNSISRGMIML